jgi:hypothetical protein
MVRSLYLKIRDRQRICSSFGRRRDRFRQRHNSRSQNCARRRCNKTVASARRRGCAYGQSAQRGECPRGGYCCLRSRATERPERVPR